MFPLLAWLFLATYEYFDGFRAKSLNIKATYTIADALSREVNEPVTPEYMDSLNALYWAMSVHARLEMFRVTAVRYVGATDTYQRVWSQVRGSGLPLTDANLADMRDTVLPIMYDGEVGILVETRADVVPYFDFVNLAEFDVQNTMILRPRFAPQICWSDSNNGPWNLTNPVCNI